MKNNIEKWAEIKGYDGRYQISNMGNIRRVVKWHPRKREYLSCEPELLTPTGNGSGYMIIGLSDRGIRKNYYIHRLVAEAFIPNPLNKRDVNHLDFNRANNNVSNLEWCTHSENMIHAEPHLHTRRWMDTNTGESYISKKIKNGHTYYRVIVDKKEKIALNMEDAMRIRDEMLGGVSA